MNCHGNNNGNGKGKDHKGHKGHMGHMLMMALCCGAPAIILILLPFIGKVGDPGFSKALFGITPFLCPLMMVFMIPMMFKGNKEKQSCHEDNQVKLPPAEKTQE